MSEGILAQRPPRITTSVSTGVAVCPSDQGFDGLSVSIAPVLLSFGGACIHLGLIHAGADVVYARRHIALCNEAFCFCDEFRLGFDGRDDLV
jgi:hypothetical protein